MRDRNTGKLLHEIDPVGKLIPVRGFFRDWYDLGKEGEICPRFFFFVAATVLGSVVNRKVWFQRGTVETFPTLYPNPWIILVAPQAKGHKSASLRIGKRMLNNLPLYAKPRVLASKLTPEVLCKNLASTPIPEKYKKMQGISHALLKESATALLYSSELSVLLGREKYMTGMIPLLTDLYDCPDEWETSTITRGDDVLYNVCLTMLGASTPQWMQRILPDDAFAGGFMSRIQLITMPAGWDQEEPDPPPAPPQTVERIIGALSALHNVQGEMKWDEEAKEFFFDFYHKRRIASRSLTGAVEAYRERKPDHLLRFAMLLQLTYTFDELILKKGSLEQALRILDAVEKDSEAVVDYVSTPIRMRPAQAMLEALRVNGRLTEGELIQKTFREMSHPRDIEATLTMLREGEMIKMITYKGKVGYEHSFKG